MKQTAMLIAATGGLLVLAACGKGSQFDKAFKEEGRKQFVEQCESQAGKQVPAGAEIDIKGICGCAAGKIIDDDKSAMEITKSLTDEKLAMEAMTACIKEQGLMPGADSVGEATKGS